MSEVACYAERQPGHDPNDNEGCPQNQKEEVCGPTSLRTIHPNWVLRSGGRCWFLAVRVVEKVTHTSGTPD